MYVGTNSPLHKVEDFFLFSFFSRQKVELTPKDWSSGFQGLIKFMKSCVQNS